MTVETHLEMHVDHKRWSSEQEHWKDDISIWDKEIGGALTDLEKLKSALEQHRKALQDHSAATQRLGQSACAHEHQLAEYERGESDDKLIAMAKSHQDEAEKQASYRSVHERVKKHHHTVMAHWNLLSKAIGQSL